MKKTRDFYYFTITNPELKYRFAEFRGSRDKAEGKKKRFRGKKIYLGELSSFRVPRKDLKGMKNLKVVFTDRYRQKTKPLKIKRK